MTTLVLGHRGMVGSALIRRLRVSAPPKIDLRDRTQVRALFEERPWERVFLAAARVGGIGANVADPVAFLEDNLLIGVNVLQAAYVSGVRRLVNLGSSCIYPRDAPQPLTEDALLTGPLERTNEAYALAKIAILKLVDAYRRQQGADYCTVMPTNLYGPGDRYDAEKSHVIPAMILKFELAHWRKSSSVELWGSGTPLREFLFVDDLADALVTAMDASHLWSWINVGSGEEIAIADLAFLVADTVGFKGRITWNRERPDGTPRKILDSTKIRDLGWRPTTSLANGLELAVEDFRRRYRGTYRHIPGVA